MKGLLKNNLYATLSNMKVFSAVMLLLGAVGVAIEDNRMTFITGYMLFGMVGFSFNVIAGMRKECVSKWSRYKLTMPVKRSDIVKSYFISQLLWLFAGMLFAGAEIGLSWLFHGFPFDRDTDIFIVFVAGIGMSLLMGAIFIPLFHLGGEERNEVILVISLTGAVGIFIGLVRVVNIWIGPKPPTWQVILGAFILLICAAAAFILSYPLTLRIFKKKEF